jgi:hypothetical protein
MPPTAKLKAPCQNLARSGPESSMYNATLPDPNCPRSCSCATQTFTHLPGVQNAATGRSLPCPSAVCTDGTPTNPKIQVEDPLVHGGCGYGGIVRTRRNGGEFPGKTRRQFVLASLT